jgi:hypothetical protein
MTNNGLELSLEDLKGKQSVRATFRLPRQVIELLSLIAAQLGIKQKSLFDQLFEDPAVLKTKAAENAASSESSGERVQKTYVISRSTLDTLERMAGKQNIPRDILVEISINRLLPVIKTEQEKHEKRKILLREMQKILQQERKILGKAESLLGEKDQLSEMIRQQVGIGERNVAAVKDLIARGKPMEGW